MKTIIGKCSLCGGIVSCPTVQGSVVPIPPTCERCGAVEDPDLPVLRMKESKLTTQPNTQRFIQD